MNARPKRAPRKIVMPSEDDNQHEKANKAFSILLEFTSRRMLATLERLPTPSELVIAIDTFDRLGVTFVKRDPEWSREFRAAALSWKGGRDVPDSLIDTARRYIAAFHGREPKGGWDASDGYPYWEQDEGDPAAEISELEECDPSNPSHRARSLAIAVFDFLNVGAMLAAPRAWAKLKEFPSKEHLLGHIDSFLATFEARPRQEPMREMAEKLRVMLVSWEPGAEIPQEIARVARTLMDYARMPEPPGGWDGYEGPPARLNS
jgi:hypothetical protein